MKQIILLLLISFSHQIIAQTNPCYIEVKKDGDVLYKQGKYQEAIAMYQKGVDNCAGLNNTEKNNLQNKINEIQTTLKNLEKDQEKQREKEERDIEKWNSTIKLNTLDSYNNYLNTSDVKLYFKAAEDSIAIITNRLLQYEIIGNISNKIIAIGNHKNLILNKNGSIFYEFSAYSNNYSIGGNKYIKHGINYFQIKNKAVTKIGFQKGEFIYNLNGKCSINLNENSVFEEFKYENVEYATLLYRNYLKQSNGLSEMKNSIVEGYYIVKYNDQYYFTNTLEEKFIETSYVKAYDNNFFVSLLLKDDRCVVTLIDKKLNELRVKEIPFPEFNDNNFYSNFLFRNDTDQYATGKIPYFKFFDKYYEINNQEIKLLDFEKIGSLDRWCDETCLKQGGNNSNQFRIVGKNGKFGCINENKEVVIPFKYDNITGFYWDEEYKEFITKVTLNGVEYWMDKNENTLSTTYINKIKD